MLTEAGCCSGRRAATGEVDGSLMVLRPAFGGSDTSSRFSGVPLATEFQRYPGLGVIHVNGL